MEDITIESLISQKRVVTTSDLSNPSNDYVMIGVYQNGTSKSKGDGTSYKNYVIPLTELLGGPVPITANVIPAGTGASIADGKWSFVGNNLVPLTTGSDIGTDALRAGTIYSGAVHAKINNGVGSYWGAGNETIEIRKTNSIYTDSGIIFKTSFSNIYSGIITEVGGQILSMGINVDQIDTNYVNTRYGGIFRFDTRPGFPYFSVIRKDFFNNPFLDFCIDTTGHVGIGTGGGAISRLHIYDDDGWNQLLLEKPYTPDDSLDANGAPGNICWDEDNIYVKTAGGWKLANIFSF